jgi:hypothetical protein
MPVPPPVTTQTKPLTEKSFSALRFSVETILEIRGFDLGQWLSQYFLRKRMWKGGVEIVECECMTVTAKWFVKEVHTFVSSDQFFLK